MSESRPIQVMDRIASAPPWSPILVHRGTTPGRVGAVFSATSKTQSMIASGRYAEGGPMALIGIWSQDDWKDDWESIKTAIKSGVA